ncbi:MAG: hypothetical protein AW09_002087 [Candidatus Accumulibacter phosphatis]|jgi:hypothetical protein|uniref:Uncharacterized protein n=1 Tax=Candidatus Accumulibacter phosphatis TaxID=327160 RepID=A0A080M6H8_9PROT|nr:MAG: hypothetical protein AW09_002087 [Candidatus Accumulibacter phosphatis]
MLSTIKLTVKAVLERIDKRRRNQNLVSFRNLTRYRWKAVLCALWQSNCQRFTEKNLLVIVQVAFVHREWTVKVNAMHELLITSRLEVTVQTPHVSAMAPHGSLSEIKRLGLAGAEKLEGDVNGNRSHPPAFCPPCSMARC